MALERNKPIVCPVLIGREADLTALQVLIDQAKRGERQVARLAARRGLANRGWQQRQKPMLSTRASYPCKGTAFKPIAPYHTPPFSISSVRTLPALLLWRGTTIHPPLHWNSHAFCLTPLRLRPSNRLLH